MNILALESSATACSAALCRDGALIAQSFQCSGLTHSRTLLPMVEDMLKNSELSVQEMDAVAVAAGPGSFTGLRIGVATAKGLAWAQGKPWPLEILTSMMAVRPMITLAVPIRCTLNLMAAAISERHCSNLILLALKKTQTSTCSRFLPAWITDSRAALSTR